MTGQPTLDAGGKLFGAAAALFDPTKGDVVLEPEGTGSGYWVGAPTVLWDGAERCWWLTYRRRRPRGENPDGRGDRGYVARVARSADGLRFEDVWEVTQGQWRSPSMEKFSLVRDGKTYRLYASYVDPADGRWRIDVLEAPHPSKLDARAARPVFTAESVQRGGEGVEGVKDPYVFRAGDTWHMLISYAAARPPQSDDERRRMHGTADIYNTGLTTAPTALATSEDGLSWRWEGCILDCGRGDAWDRYQSRLNSCLRLGSVWLGYYDGAASEKENYEERCGVAASLDLRHWTKLTPHGPAVVAPHGSGSVRYVEAVLHEGALHVYYEYARPDGAHELRRAIVALTP